MSEKHFILKYNDNWADEMDISGFAVMTESERDEYFAVFKKVFDINGYYTFVVGTNEEVEYNTLQDFTNAFHMSEITEEEAKVFSKFFGNEFGFFPTAEYVEFEDEDEDEEAVDHEDIDDEDEE
jgi:hypothetical protein